MTATHHHPCDTLGGCQHRAQPCNGCTPAPRRSHRICTANRCHQGRTPCPCPQACELPTDPLQDDRMSAAEGVLLVLVATLAAAIFIMAVLASAA